MEIRSLLRLWICFLVLIAFVIHPGLAQLVLPGDFPDPSVVRVKSEYWATATSSNWAPAYPLLKSTDLVHWESQGYVFETLPAWADYYFWAPEITYDKGQVFVYYTAHKRGGNLCIAAASAKRPQGPYRDLGPLMCEDVGSIDAFPMRDEKGKLYMIWKEDGNSVNKPTPIWAMPMKEDRSALVGEKVKLFSNELEWEKNLVEGVSMIRHGGYFYAFYAAAGCCGRNCNYVTGVARAKKLLGPWEKFEGNPILGNENEWICPGHGTPVLKDGKFYFLYHAYNKDSHVFAGRQGLLREFTFTSDGWIKFIALDSNDVRVPAVIAEEFDQSHLSDSWQWSVFREAKPTLKQGKLYLASVSDKYRTYLGRRTFNNNYKIRAVISRKESNAQASVALIGDDRHMAGVSVEGDKLTLFKVDGDLETIYTKRDVPSSDQIFIEIDVTLGKNMVCSYSTDGVTFETLNDQAMDGDFLPPWDRAVRAGIASMGVPGRQAVFESFTIFNSDKPQIK